MLENMKSDLDFCSLPHELRTMRLHFILIMPFYILPEEPAAVINHIWISSASTLAFSLPFPLTVRFSGQLSRGPTGQTFSRIKTEPEAKPFCERENIEQKISIDWHFMLIEMRTRSVVDVCQRLHLLAGKKAMTASGGP